MSMNGGLASSAPGGLARACFFALLSASATAQSVEPRYRIAGEIRVGVASWDFLTIDVQNRRLYGIGNYVIDIEGDSVVGRLQDTAARGGFLVAPDLGRGMARNGTIFRLDDGVTIEKLRVRGDAMLYDSVTRRAFLFGDTTTAVDLATGRIAGRLVLGASPESAVSDEHGRVYVNLADHDSVGVIDTRSLRIIQRWSIRPCQAPMAMSIDPSTSRLFIGCILAAATSTSGGRESARHAVAVFNPDDGQFVTVMPLPGRTETDESAFDPNTRLLFNPSADGSLSIVRVDGADRYTLIQILALSRHASNKVVVDPRTRRVFMPFSDERSRMAGVVILTPSTAQ